MNDCSAFYMADSYLWQQKFRSESNRAGNFNKALVQSQAVDGTSLEEGAISVTLGTASADPFFVALRNGDETDAEDLTFTVIDADGVTYRGSKNIPAAFKPNGTFVSMKNATLNDRLGVSLSATEVATVW